MGSADLPAHAAPTAELPPTGQTYDHYPAMQEVYQDYFHVGIFGRGNDMDALIYNYGSYTPGNEMKPESTQPEKGQFTFDPAEAAMAEHAAHNPDLLFFGHALAWHSQTPSWMWDAPPARYDQPGEYDPEVAQENLRQHIQGVLGHFGDRLEAIDVVNEAVEHADPSDWRASLSTGQGWYPALGSDWVEMAFLEAAEVVDENGWDVKLTYNDFGLNNPDKARVVYEMVKEINERNEGVRPDGKQLIEVIGMQGHYGLNTDISDVEGNIQLFATLPGVEIHITEMDVGVPPGELTEEKENNQGMQYAELFRVFRDYAAGPANTTGNPRVITTVKLAGVRDVTEGWKAGEYAMPYDYEGRAKKALLGILYPEEFLATHDWMEPEHQDDDQEPVPGVHVYHAERGDGYTGANIILGNDASQWPWSTAGEDGEVAFEPEPGATYRLTVNYTPSGTTSLRVRWVRDESNGGYTSADGAVVNDYQYGADEVATHIPAYFNSGMVNMGTYDLVTEVTLDGDQPADGLIGNIAIRGGGGGSAYTINSLRVEKLEEDGGSELLVSWPQATDPADPEDPSESPDPTEEPTEPTPTATPTEPTASPEPSEEPDPTASPDPSEEPSGPAESPDPTESPEPTETADPESVWPPSAEELTDQNRGAVEILTDPAVAGQEIQVSAGSEASGQTLRSWLFSEPEDLGESAADAEGSITVTLPEDSEGEHRLAVYTTAGELIGWTELTIVPAGDEGAGLARTGATVGGLLLAALALLGLGGSALLIARRRAAQR
ncbi:endo-1,4-beta-xylanase [Nesterenkonia alkaliphila]|uniref:endo-1,4-beta-xylanase n=1 Tax=Nesterenkonia alkaliphila TaxID=1463631 RepID=UPI0016649962|nr:endo-1,4-beta-xylanase [Nesterenkonia alkaliphila]